MRPSKVLKILIIAFLVVSALLNILFWNQKVADTDYLWVLIASFLFAGLIFIDMFSFWGTRKSLVFIGVVSLISFISEFIGTRFGGIFGSSYTYNILFGPTIGRVPIVVVVTWVALVYICYLMAQAVLDEKIENRFFTKKISYILIKSILIALLAVSWDLAWDPLAVKRGVWHWSGTGPYFGIPTSNFIGWIIVVLASVIIFDLIYIKHEKPVKKDIFLPFFGYLNFYIAVFFLAYKINLQAVFYIASFLMLPPLLILLAKGIKNKEAK